jgi:predicted nucleic acid-binding protein
VIEQAERSLTNYVRSWPVYDIASQAVLEAVRGVQRYHFTYWDALIWATAKLNNTLTILTEDLPSSNLIEGVRFVNPFAAYFHLSVLG